MKIFWLIACFFISQCYAQKADFDHIDFSKADSIALAYKNEKLDNLADLSYNLTSHLETDVERFRAIYMWVCTNIENDYTQYLRNERKRKRFNNDSLKLKTWNNGFKQDVFKKLIKNKKTICTGYAYLVKKLTNLSGLDCEIINGYGRTSTSDIDKLNTPNHSWNTVNLNGKWYLCDPTWASGNQHAETLTFTFNYNDGYFLANPELFAINHFPLEQKWFLTDTKPPSFENFKEAPVIYGNAYNYLANHSLPNKLNNTIRKHETIIFKFELLKLIKPNNISFQIDNGFDVKTTEPKSIRINNLSITLEHLFNKVGFYDLHLMIDDNYIATYTFEIEG